jgi:hypothetical protein
MPRSFLFERAEYDTGGRQVAGLLGVGELDSSRLEVDLVQHAVAAIDQRKKEA